MLKIINRPLSPHLTIYTSQITSVYSIWHRITGLSMLLILIFFILLCKLSSYFIVLTNLGNPFFNISLWLQNSFFLNFILLITYHSINGLRHINWDLGFNLLIKAINFTAKSIILFLVIIIFTKLQSIIN